VAGRDGGACRGCGDAAGAAGDVIVARLRPDTVAAVLEDVDWRRRFPVAADELHRQNMVIMIIFLRSVLCRYLDDRNRPVKPLVPDPLLSPKYSLFMGKKFPVLRRTGNFVQTVVFSV
jgi:hypothetical protein